MSTVTPVSAVNISPVSDNADAVQDVSATDPVTAIAQQLFNSLLQQKDSGSEEGQGETVPDSGEIAEEFSQLFQQLETQSGVGGSSQATLGSETTPGSHIGLSPDSAEMAAMLAQMGISNGVVIPLLPLLAAKKAGNAQTGDDTLSDGGQNLVSLFMVIQSMQSAGTQGKATFINSLQGQAGALFAAGRLAGVTKVLPGSDGDTQDGSMQNGLLQSGVPSMSTLQGQAGSAFAGAIQSSQGGQSQQNSSAQPLQASLPLQQIIQGDPSQNQMLCYRLLSGPLAGLILQASLQPNQVMLRLFPQNMAQYNMLKKVVAVLESADLKDLPLHLQLMPSDSRAGAKNQ